MPIAMNYDVQVNPGVLSAGGRALSMNAVILTNNVRAPIGQVVPFSSLDTVSAYFGASSTEALLAAKYFAGYENKTLTPGRLYFAQYPSASVAAYLRGASVASLSLSQLQAINGTLTVTVDGVLKTAASLNLSGAASFSAAAALIQTALGSGQTTTYDSQTNAFVITSTTTGASSTISQGGGTTAASLGLSAGTLSQGAIAAVPATFMTALIAITQDWASFMTTFEPNATDEKAFATWNTGRNKRFVYVAWDTDANAIVANDQTTFGAWLNANKPDGVCLISGSAAVATIAGTTLATILPQHAAFVCGSIACQDFMRLNARPTYKFKTQAGLVPAVSDESTAAILTANGYNFYGAYATAAETNNYLAEGSVSGSFLWLDSYVNQIWLNNALQLALSKMLQASPSIPYNPAGYSILEAACLDPIRAGINYGAIRTGVILSSAQTSQINAAAGLDAASAVSQHGFYLQIKDPGALARGQRQSPSNSLFYSDGGSVHKIVLASTNVQ